MSGRALHLAGVCSRLSATFFAEKPMLPNFSRREAEIMDVIYRLGHATAEDVRDELADQPGLTSIRKLLYVLEKKRHLAHEAQGKANVYYPTMPANEASARSLSRLMKTYFGGSARRVVMALLEDEETDLSEEDLERIAKLATRTRRS